jgi:hypothetical protein
VSFQAFRPGFLAPVQASPSQRSAGFVNNKRHSCCACATAVLIRFSGLEGYATKPAAFFKRMASRPSLDGLYPNCFERSSGVITFGADGDSFYECVCLLLPFPTASAEMLLV